jgi:carboxylate-amine ligase
MGKEPDFTLGIEEEYLLVHEDTLDVAEVPQEMMKACEDELGDQVSHEYMNCQVEIGTKVCGTVDDAREDLKRLRGCIAKHAQRHGLAVLGTSCHPVARWQDQHHTPKERYDGLRQDLGGVARRLLICGMHCHVGIGEDDLRIDLMNQFGYFLPHLLALSCSSPYWQGEDTGLASYRMTVIHNLPRTGLPPRLGSYGEYQRSVQALVDTGVIEDSSKIWWDMRPSGKFKTLEARIYDLAPRMEHALTLAALTQATMRMLWRLRQKNQRWRIYDSFLVSENRWRAQRYGMSEGLIDFGRGEIVPFDELIEEWIEMIAEDAEALGCLTEVAGARDIVVSGNASDRQRTIHAAELELSGDEDKAMRKMMQAMVEEFTADL